MLQEIRGFYVFTSLLGPDDILLMMMHAFCWTFGYKDSSIDHEEVLMEINLGKIYELRMMKKKGHEFKPRAWFRIG